MKKHLFHFIVAAGFALAGTSAHAANPPASDRLLQQELKQQQIKSSTQRVADQLAAVIAEFERNAIEGQDVNVLRAIGGVLGRLTAKDMERVIGLLQQARGAEDPSAGTRQTTEAYTGQRSIMSQLNQLVLEYQRQQALYELSLRFKEYAERQTGNMWQGVALARETESRSVNAFSETQQSSLRVQQIDQENLREEVRLTVKKLEQIAMAVMDGATAERPKAAINQAKQGGLDTALTGAIEDLNAGKLLSATGNEKRSRDQMREIARLLLLAQGDLAALRQALQEVERTIDTQKQVTEETRTVEKDQAQSVQSRQAEVVDATDLVRRDISSLAPVAAEHLRNATENMQDARSVLSSERDPKKQREKAPPKQEAAQGKLEQARQALQEQIAKAEQAELQPENNLEMLRRLQEQVRNTMEAEEQLKKETADKPKDQLAAEAPKQGEIKDRVQDMQQQAAKPSPAAAQSLGEAARQMQKAQSSMAAAQNNPAAQQAAVDALQQADQQLAQDIAQLEQDQQELAQLEELLRKLAGVITEQQKVQFGTAKAATEPQGKQTGQARELAGKQESLGSDTGELKNEAAGPVPPAAEHLGKAQEDMKAAKADLDKPAPREALPDQTEALTDLYAAQREIEDKANQLRDKLGLSPQDNQQSLADAAARIQQAQEQVDRALTEMQQAPPGLLDALLQQQKQIASSLAEMAGNPAGTPPPDGSREAAEAAARELGEVDLPEALEAMKKSEKALTDAAADKKPPGTPPAQTGKPALPQLAQQQQEVRAATEELLNNLQSATESAMNQAEESLEQAGSAIAPLTSGQMGPLPRAAQSALQSAQGSLASGAAEAGAKKGVPAQAQAAGAAQSLAAAQSALALAQAGLGSDSVAASGKGQQKGQQPGQGKGQAQASGQQGSGKGTPSPQGTGRRGNWDAAGGTEGPRSGRAGQGSYLSLPARDRAAILQSQSEKYPQEYGPLVEQYLKNLSDDADEP